MKITNVAIENFLMIGKAEAKLDDRGLVLIQGENNDDTSQNSNGSGKSSFADAISWCLFGFTAREEVGDTVINNTAKKNCSVVVTIADESGVYRVSRHRKHKTHKNRLMLESLSVEPALDMTLGTDKLTQEAINKVMGCSEDVFRAAIYMGQEQMPDLPSMTDKFLKALIEEAAGIDRLQRAYDIARARYNAAREEVTAVNRRIERHEEAIKHHESTIATNEKASSDWEDKRKERLRDKAVALKALKATVEAHDTTVQSKAHAVEKAIADITKVISGVAVEQTKKSDLEKLLSEKKQSEARISVGVQTTASHLKSAIDGLSNVGKRLGTECGECGKPYCEDDLHEATVIAQRNLDKSKQDAIEKKKQLEFAREAVSGAQRDLDEFVATMTDLTAEIAAQREARMELRNLEAILSTQKDEKSDLIKGMTELGAIRDQENPYIGLGKDSVAKLDTEIESLALATKDLEEARRALAVQEMVVKTFGPAGVRAQILDTVTPFLNDRTAHYLGTLTDGNVSAIWQTLTPLKSGEIREKFSIEAQSRVGAKSFKGLSGGEKRKVRLACAMALQDLVASRATKPIELFIADEIDDALDDSGRERLMSILEEKSRMRGTVLVISHNSLKDWIREVVVFVKEGGYSTLKGEALS